VIREVQERGKPFLVLLNCADPSDPLAEAIRLDIEDRYGVRCLAANCLELDEAQVSNIIGSVLEEFPMRELDIFLPSWVDALPYDHPIKSGLYTVIRDCTTGIRRMSDVNPVISLIGEHESVEAVEVSSMDMGTGVAQARLSLPRELFYETISQCSGFQIGDDGDLLSLLVGLAKVKTEYDKVETALQEVRETGYGIVVPSMHELSLEEPEIVRQGGRYGVRLKASAPSVHMIRADIETEVSPIVGNEKQSEEMIHYLLQEFEGDTSKIWDSNIFGKSFHDIVSDDLQGKLKRMPEDARMKFRETLQRMINEGSGGLICIIL
jgi:Stage IV sporulation protein A (spore_IV_A).